MLENYLNTEQAAAIIGCSDAHVRRMLIEGTLLGKKVSERSWMIPKAEAEKMAATVPATGRPRKNASK